MTISISVFNESTATTDAAVQAMLPAFSQQWNNDLVPSWGVDPVLLNFLANSQAPPATDWWLVFLDDSDQADALAYHDLTNTGLPISKVFVKTILADKGEVSVGASHELCEMAVDPWINSAYQDANGVFWAGEICDPVEDDQYGYKIGDILVTDFVTPNWFGHEHAQGPVDFKGHATAPFTVLTGGYAQKFDGTKWTQVTGNLALKSASAVAPVGSRRGRRFRRMWDEWQRSEAKW